MENNNKIKKIDVESALKSKNPKLHRMLPKFILNYIKKVTHEKDINNFLAVNGDLKDHQFVKAVVEHFNLNIAVNYPENIKPIGGVIVASNHPLGGLDALALMNVLRQKREDFKFIVNDILMQIKNLEGLFIGINKHGKNAVNTIMGIDDLYASEKMVLIFPAGLVSRKQSGKIKDLEWKKSFVTKAKKYKRDIIPVHIEASNTRKFYNLALWRKRFGIKANIEMFYLIDEMFKQKNKTITITFGKAIPYTVFDKRFSDLEWAQKVKDHVYALHSGDITKLIAE